MSEPLPPAIWDLLRAYLRAGRTGSIELHIKQGRVQSWRVIECGRVGDPVAELVTVGDRVS